jgi:hypothetical protein
MLVESLVVVLEDTISASRLGLICVGSSHLGDKIDIGFHNLRVLVFFKDA